MRAILFAICVVLSCVVVQAQEKQKKLVARSVWFSNKGKMCEDALKEVSG